MITLRKIAAAALSLSVLTACITGCGDKSSIINYDAPKNGEEVIVMTIKDYGDVKIKLMPEASEKGVENFIGLVEEGYYDGLTFHRIIQDFMIQGGDPEGTGMGGESMWGGKFDGGTSENAIHAAGAVAYANSGATSTNGSQFYIVTGEKYAEEDLESLESSYGMEFTDEAKKIYTEEGGTPWLDGSYTVFGQVYDGLDIIFDIQNVDTDSSDKPIEDVIIEKVTVEEYNGEDLKFKMSDYE